MFLFISHIKILIKFRIKILCLFYDKEFILSESIRYISDSGAYWKEKPLDEILKENNKSTIHLLIHPELYFFSDKKILNERINKIIDYKGMLLKSLAEEELNSLRTKKTIYKNDKKKSISFKPC